MSGSYQENAYDDEMKVCERTHASLFLYHDSAHPHDVGDALDLLPVEMGVRGERLGYRDGVWEESRKTSPSTYWKITSENEVASRDSSRHIDWLLYQLEGRDEAWRGLLARGWRAKVAVFWESAYGDGGPTTAPSTMRRLGELEIRLWFDVYFPYEEPPRIVQAIEAYNAKQLAAVHDPDDVDA